MAEKTEDITVTVTDDAMLASASLISFKSGNTRKALAFINAAIAMNDSEFRYFINRCVLFQKLRNYESAFKDIERALFLNPVSPKAHFLRATTLIEIGAYFEAEKSLRNVVSLNAFHDDVSREMFRIKVLIAQQYGINPSAALQVALKFNDLKDMVKYFSELPFHKRVNQNHASKIVDNVTHVSEEPNLKKETTEKSSDKIIANSIPDACRQLRCIQGCDYLEEPTNLMHSKAIHLSNLSSTVTESQVSKIFSKYGHILNIALYFFCGKKEAIVDFDNEFSTVAAIAEFYHKPLFCSAELNNDNVPIKIRFTPSNEQRKEGIPHQEQAHNIIQEMNECFSWRFSGDCFGKRANCRMRHIRINYDIDYNYWID